MKGKKWRLKVAIAVVLVAVLGVAGYLVFLKPSDQPAANASDTSYVVGAKGGTFTFSDGIEIIVPEGAVDDDTTLTVKDIAQVPADGHAPFTGMRTGAIAFDVSLSKDGNSDIQPTEPLGITVPLKGDLLPDGANPGSALLYSELPSVDFWYMPAVVENDVLKGELYHLSPKYISFLNEQKYLDEFWPDNGEPSESENCQETLETSAGTVEFGSATSGWSNTDTDSPINVCLQQDGETIHAGVINRVNHVLAVTTDDMDVAVSSGNIEEGLVTFFAGLMPGSDAHLVRDGRLDASVATSDLPASVELQANVDTFLLEAAWFGIKLLVDVFTGGAGSEAFQAVVNTIELISCVQEMIDVASGDINLLNVANILTSLCAEVIANEFGVDLGWGLFGRWFTAVGYIVDALQLIATAFTGFTMQFEGTMTVELAQKYLAPECLSEWEAHAAGITYWNAQEGVELSQSELEAEVEEQMARITLEVVCTDEWMTTLVTAGADGIILYKWNGSSWERLGSGSYWTGDHPDLCAVVPQAVYDRLGC